MFIHTYLNSFCTWCKNIHTVDTYIIQTIINIQNKTHTYITEIFLLLLLYYILRLKYWYRPDCKTSPLRARFLWRLLPSIFQSSCQHRTIPSGGHRRWTLRSWRRNSAASCSGESAASTHGDMYVCMHLWNDGNFYAYIHIYCAY